MDPPDVLNTPDVLNIPRCTEHTLYRVVVRGRGMYDKLVNLYKMKFIVMFQNFIEKRGVML